MREAVKRVVRVLAFLAVVPQLISFAVRARIVGRDRALEGSTQALGLVPGLVGQYLRRAFLAHAITSCHETAAISFGTIFSQTGARIGRGVAYE
jgi:virginiamycin A acetyltransferase